MYLHTQVQLTTVHHAVMELREVGRTLAPSALARIVLFFLSIIDVLQLKDLWMPLV